jgi:hypothetical protein
MDGAERMDQAPSQPHALAACLAHRPQVPLALIHVWQSLGVRNLPRFKLSLGYWPKHRDPTFPSPADAGIGATP